MSVGPADVSGGGGNLSVNGRELARRALAQGRDRCDADDRDERHEQCVLDERGATFVLDVSLDPGVQELVAGDHFRVDSLLCVPRPVAVAPFRVALTSSARSPPGLYRTLGPFTSDFAEAAVLGPCESPDRYCRCTIPMRTACRTAWVRSRASSFW